MYYRSRKDPLTALRQRMRELAQTRVRFGYRRLRVLLRREGWEVGKERFYRVYTEEGLALRRKRPWRHATAVHREQRRPATARNDIWSMDFVADRTRRWPALPRADGDRSVHARVPGDRRRAKASAARTSPPRSSACASSADCRSGSTATTAPSSSARRWICWAYTNGVILDFSRRGKPTDNATIESFNGRFREECLNVHWFASLEDAQQKIDAFRWDYNEHHPHRALKGLSPREFARRAMHNGRRLTLVVVRKTRSPQPPRTSPS